MGLCTIGFILFVVCVRLLLACKFMSRFRHRVPITQKRNKYNEQGSPEEEMQEILNPNPEPVYSQTPINEPSFIRDYAPLPLEDARNSIQPSAPNIHQQTLETDSKTNATERMYPSLANRLSQFIPNLKFNHHPIRPVKEENKPGCTGSHTTCSYVAGYGMVWEDLCTCNLEQASGAIPKTF